MRYFVITAKHHDGFAIYHSKHSDFDVENTSQWERDPLKELSDACRKHGLKFGVYYSQSQDWHDVFDPSGDWKAPGNPAIPRDSAKWRPGQLGPGAVRSRFLALGKLAKPASELYLNLTITSRGGRCAEARGRERMAGRQPARKRHEVAHGWHPKTHRALRPTARAEV